MLFACMQLENTEQAGSLALLRLFSTGMWQDYTGLVGLLATFSNAGWSECSGMYVRGFLTVYPPFLQQTAAAFHH
jgi:hypothetical protein